MPVLLSPDCLLTSHYLGVSLPPIPNPSVNGNLTRPALASQELAKGNPTGGSMGAAAHIYGRIELYSFMKPSAEDIFFRPQHRVRMLNM